MRIFAYILFLVTGGFAIFVIFTLFFSDSKDNTIDTVSVSQDVSDISSAITDPSASSEDIQSEIDLLRQEIKVLKKRIEDTSDTPLSSSSSDASVEEVVFSLPDDIYKRISQEYTIDTLPAKDVFGFYMFGNLPTTVYAIKNARIYVFGESYSVIRKNLDLAKSVYSFNETNTFFGRSYFLNSNVSDSVIRFVFEYAGVSVGVEILESEYDSFKNLILSSDLNQENSQLNIEGEEGDL